MSRSARGHGGRFNYSQGRVSNALGVTVHVDGYVTHLELSIRDANGAKREYRFDWTEAKALRDALTERIDEMDAALADARQRSVDEMVERSRRFGR